MGTYQNFALKRVSKEEQIIAYHWEREHPDYVVLLIHGIGEYDGRYERVATAFGEANVAVLGIDLRGHGRSMGPQGHCAPRREVLSDIDELIEYAQILYPGVPLILYGHSMGGNIALDYRSRGTYNAEMAGYIISAPWVLLVQRYPRPVVAAMKAFAKLLPRRTVSSAVDEAILGNPASVRPYRDDPYVHDKISLQCAVEGFTIGEALAAGRHEENGGAAGIPTLLMHGSADRICDVEGSRRIAAREGDALTYVEWEGYFHEIHNGNATETGDRVIARMIEFVKTI